MDTNVSSGTMTCPWCKSASAGLICLQCKWPNRWMIGVVTLYTLSALAIVPLFVTFAAPMYSARQENTAGSVATHEKLMASYLDFAATHSAYRHASVAIAFLAASSAPTISAKDLKAAAQELDTAFDSIGAKLSPFEDVERRYWPNRPSLLGGFWQNCFIHAYFSKDGFWPNVEKHLAQCDRDNCPVDVARSITAMLPGIDQPQCDPLGPDLQLSRGGPVNMTTIWYELDSIMAKQCVADKITCKSLS